MTPDLERIRAAVASANPAELRGSGACSGPTAPGVPLGDGPALESGERRYRFYRLIHGQKIYLFCRTADTPQRANAALFTEADWEQWAEAEGLEREEVD